MSQPFVVSMKITGDGTSASAAVRQVSQEVETLRRTVTQAAGGTQGRIDAMLGIGSGRSAAAAAGDIAAYGKKLDDLRAKHNPLFAAERQHAANLADIRAAYNVGAIGADELAAAVDREKAAHLAAVAALDGHSQAHLRNTAAMARSNAQRVNLLFQLQDIAVTLAMGMNPLMVAMQQGSQISMIYGPGEGGLGKALKETGNIATGVVGRLGPLLVIVGLLTLGFAAMTTEINRTAATQVSIGDVLLASWELAAEGIMGAMQPVIAWLAGIWDWISPGINIAMNALIGSFDIAFRNIKSIWNGLPGALGDFTIQTANAVIGGIENMINGAVDLLNGFIRDANGLLEPLGMSLGEGISKVSFGKFDNPFAGANDNLNEELAQNGADVRAKTLAGGYTTDIGVRAQEIASRPSDKEMKKAGEEIERQAEAYRDITRSAAEYISQQELARQTLGMSTEAASRLRREQELLNKAANDNIKLTPVQKAEIEALAAGMAAAEEQTRRLTEVYDFGKSTFNGFFADLKSELMNGASLWDGFANAGANALNTIADKALGMAADGIWDLIFNAFSGTLGGGATGGSWGNGLWGSAIFGNIGQNARGTDNWRGGLTWVGEEGPELVNLPAGSRVLSNRNSMEMAFSATPQPVGGSAAGYLVNNFYVSTPNPRAFAESRSSVARAASRLVGLSGRHS